WSPPLGVKKRELSQDVDNAGEKGRRALCRADFAKPYQDLARISYSAAIFSASAKDTDTNWETPRSAMVTPNSRSIRLMVRAWWVMTRKRVPDISAIRFSILQKRSTLASSSGASTSSSTQTGAGLTRNTAKIRAMAVSACSPPDSKARDWRRLPGG